jgi:hypothetical protein
MIQDHQTIVAAVIALFTAGLAYLAATVSARAQAEARHIQQTELVEAMRAEVAFRMFRIFAQIKSWYDTSANTTTVDYETKLESILTDAPELYDSAISTIRQAWREIGKMPVQQQRSYRKFLGEAEMLIDALRTSVYGLKAFKGQGANLNELGWTKIMQSFRAHTDHAWETCPRVREEIKRFADR